MTLLGITVQGKTVNVTSGPSVSSAFDTGTTLIYGPAADVKAIWAAVPGAAPVSGLPEFYQYRVLRYSFTADHWKLMALSPACDTMLNITVSFGGKAWPINPVDINLGTTMRSGKTCVGAIGSLSDTVSPMGPNWVFGLAFLVRM